MRFWDTSALVPLLIEERTTPQMQQAFEQDPALYVWWATPVECASALAKNHREGGFGAEDYAKALEALAYTSETWRAVAPSASLRPEAIRMVRVHALKAADALQLAAAREWARQRPAGHVFVSLDRRLRDAARREGFTVQPQ